MLTMILLTASLLPAPRLSLECANIASAETQAVTGPGGVTAVLKVSSHDDHSKNSHECEAEYQLIISGGAGAGANGAGADGSGGGGARTADVMTSDGDWGRKLSLRLSGFSPGGQHVLGLFSEGGKYPLTMLFDVRVSDGATKVVDLTKSFKGILTASCVETAEVIGTTEGGIVVELRPAGTCKANGRWVADDSGKRAKRVGEKDRILGLYGESAP